MNAKGAGQWKAAVMVLAALACGSAVAQTLYKLIDKNGKVTYSEVAPKDFDGQVIPITVDPNANTATLPKYQDTIRTRPRDEAARASRVEELKERLAQRKAALADAQNNPGEEDIGRMGTVKGGARPVPTEAYLKRLADLERAVKEAEADLESAAGGRSSDGKNDSNKR